MMNPVGFRFSPTEEEIIYHYILPKNLEIDTSHVDEVISTVDICSCDPWGLPAKSKIKSKDKVWYFFGRKENKYNRGDRQSRTTKSGYWKKTGNTMMISSRNKANPVKIGEKRVFVFQLSCKNNGSKNNWVMHEYHATTPLFSPTQMEMIYTICRLEYKGEDSEISSSVEKSHYLSPLVNNYGGMSTESEEPLSERIQSQELENPCQISDYELEEIQLEDDVDMALNNDSSDNWKSFFSVDEQNIIVSMQEEKF